MNQHQTPPAGGVSVKCAHAQLIAPFCWKAIIVLLKSGTGQTRDELKYGTGHGGLRFEIIRVGLS